LGGVKMKYQEIFTKLLEKPDISKKKNEILDLSGFLAQHELMAVDAVDNLNDNIDFYKGLNKLAMELITENYRLSQKFNRLVKDYNKQSKELERVRARRDKLENWKNKRCMQLKKFIKNRTAKNSKKAEKEKEKIAAA
jgi:hypothetical protein